MSFYSLQAVDGHGEPFSFETLRNKVVVIVNVASLCGFTPQYEEFELLHQKYKDDGLVILAFPCNQFAGQEPGKFESIEEFVRSKFGVTFPIMEKTIVNGEDAHPVYKYLKPRQKGALGFQGIRWNFEKFLIDRHGVVTHRFISGVTPLKIEPLIADMLKKL